MGMVLAKTDLEIGRRYAERWSTTPTLRDADLRRDRRRARARAAAGTPRITGSADLLADNPALARSIANRFPYLDPLHVLQVEMLRRYRAGDTRRARRRAASELTINAIATGLRNSG